jgi:hypothetical protein
MKMLSKYHGYFTGVRTEGVWTLDPITNGWNQGVGAGYTDTFWSATYFDLKGLSDDMETVFLDAATVQHAGFHALGGPAGANILIHDIITSIPVDPTNTLVLDAVFQSGLGFPRGYLNFEHVLYGRMQRWANDLDVASGFPELREEFQYGSLQPTASDRLYSYRFLMVNVLGDTSVILPPVRHLIQASPKAEPEYQHMMRLKRSYDLQQSPDVD